MTPRFFQIQHDGVRLQPDQRRDLKPVPRGATVGKKRNKKRPHRSAKRSLLAQVRAQAEQLAADAGAGKNVDGQQLARDALRLFRAGKREVCTDSPIAMSHLLAWALQSSAAQRLTLEASKAGLGTDRGARLLQQAAKAQGRAERSSVAAASFARLLERPRNNSDDAAALRELMQQAAKPRGDE